MGSRPGSSSSSPKAFREYFEKGTIVATNSPALPPLFLHRKNLLGEGYVSICTICAATAARASAEEDLQAAELIHICKQPILKKPPVRAG